MLTLSNFVLLSILVAKSYSSTGVCGVRGKAAGGSTQIVGGVDALPLEFPWQVSIHVIELPSNKDLGHDCGGSIINAQFIETAAHCVADGYKSPANYIVVVGEQNLYVTDPHEERIAVINITVHPQWDLSTINYDYALLKLARPLNFTGTESALMPICLPEKDQSFDGQTCTATGWGLTKDRSQGGQASPTLQKVDLPIVPQLTCRADYLGSIKVERDTMICADPLLGGKAACTGDSGGPLQCARSDGRYVLAGSTSWSGKPCGTAGKPDVFAKISTRLDWIRSIAGPTP